MELATKIKAEAKKIGFDACGIAAADALTQEYEYLQNYIEKAYHGSMSYMERNMEKRCDPRRLMPEARSVIVVLMNYGVSVFSATDIPKKNAEGISLYAQAKDYHKVLKDRLFLLQQYVLKERPKTISRCFVDTAPIMEKAWAERAGLGWIGKHSLLLHPDFGSYCFIGVLLCSEPMTYDIPLDAQKSPCTLCSRNCIKSCPTNAITDDGGLKASKCLSYESIENQNSANLQIREYMQMYYGCDICQDNCVFNRDCIRSRRLFKYEVHTEFEANPYLATLTKEDWMNMKEEDFKSHFEESPLLRLGLERIRENIKSLSS